MQFVALEIGLSLYHAFSIAAQAAVAQPVAAVQHLPQAEGLKIRLPPQPFQCPLILHRFDRPRCREQPPR